MRRPRIDRLSRHTVEALEAAGWSPDRSFDVAEWTEALAEDGHSINSEAEAVLRSLGGLTIMPKNLTGVNFANDEPLKFDPIDAGFGHRVLGEEIESIIGGSYYPIGEWLSYSSVFIGSSGHLVATGMGWLWEMGKTFEDGLELAVLANRPLVCLHTFTEGADPWPPA